MSALNPERQQARRIRIEIRQLALRIVDDYLADPADGPGREAKLVKAIEAAIHAHRGRGSRGPVAPPEPIL